MTRIIAVDLDGTLLNRGRDISPLNLRVLRNAHSAGASVVLATGRRHASISPVIARLGFSPYIISSNGALTKDPSHRTLSYHTISIPIAIDILDTFSQNVEVIGVIFDRGELGSLVVKSYSQFADFMGEEPEVTTDWIEVNNLKSALESPPIQLIMCGPTIDLKRCQDSIDSIYRRDNVASFRMDFDGLGRSFLEIASKNACKGTALVSLSRSIGSVRRDILSVGDNYNDRGMLAVCGHPFWVANAPEQLKRETHYSVTLANNEDGVAHAIMSIWPEFSPPDNKG